MSRPWKVRLTGAQTVGGLLQNVRRDDAPEPLGGRQEQPVVRSDEVVATTGPQRDGPPLRPDSRIHDGHVDAGRQVRQGCPERSAAPCEMEKRSRRG